MLMCVAAIDCRSNIDGISLGLFKLQPCGRSMQFVRDHVLMHVLVVHAPLMYRLKMQ